MTDGADPPAAVKEALRRIELLVMDFDGVLTDNTVWTADDGREMVRCWRGDGIGLSRVRALGLNLQVLSTETNEVVAARCRKLGLPHRQGLADKGGALVELWEQGLGSAETTCYVGNDVNDAACLSMVALSVVVADAHPDVLPLASYRTAAPGGYGAVRELCDLIATIRGAERPEMPEITRA